MRVASDTSVRATRISRKANPMSITLTFDRNDKVMLSMLQVIRALNTVKIEESPYDSSFVKKINARRKQETISLDINNLWE